MIKRILISTGIIFFLSLLVLLVYHFFETYPTIRWIPPSEEVVTNPYYALDQWLIETGHKIRLNDYFNTNILDTTTEKIILVEQNYYTYVWFENFEKLINWIEQGGYITVFMNNYAYNNYTKNNEELFNYLSNKGITIELAQRTYNMSETEEKVFKPPYDRSYETGYRDIPNQKNENFKPPYDRYDDLLPKIKYVNPYPSFDRLISFLIDDSDFYDSNNIFSMKDENGIIKLVEIPIGLGSLTITGRPAFMDNYSIGIETNAALSWKLTAERANNENNGILFIRGQYREIKRSLFGPIMERGNFYPVIISVILLIILGFWMVIPMFGLVSEEKQMFSRPIKDRFNAEIRFFKKYKALDYYLDVYKREHKTDEDNENKEKYNYEELINQYRRKFNGTAKF
ncbi:MAG: hypothetical protein FWD24_03920 [Treponema sp.]|nr:hypothetical protein [Treponema sp.]